MKNFCNLYIALACFLSGTGISFSQGDRCGSIQPFCAGTTEFVFQNSSRVNGNVARAESGPNYGCLETQPYPAWFYLQIEEPGNLDFQIRQTVNPDGSGALLDVDFIAWGPFQEDDAFCGNNSLSAQNTVGCSFLPSAVETFSINNAQRGEVYVVLITNFSEAAGYISLQQTNTSSPSAGETDCSIVNILGDDQKVCENEVVKLVAENVIANRYEWYVFDDILVDFRLIPNESGDTYTVAETGLYKVITINDDTGTELEDEVLIEFFDLPVATTPNDLQICNSDSEVFFDLNSTRDELLQIYPLTSEFSVNFYATQTDFENDSPISSPAAFEGRDEQEIIATITNLKSGCSSLPVKFQLQIEAPIPISIAEMTAVCINPNGSLAGSISIGEDLGANYSYEWTPFNDPDGDGIENPVYRIDALPSVQSVSVKITDLVTGCAKEFSTELKLFSPPQEVLVQIEGNDFENGFTVTGNAISGLGDETLYEYQLDNGPWQTDAAFNNVTAGNHTISAREINGCGSATSQQFRLIGYPRFFTPNSDGFNDTWNVVNDASNSISKVFIFDRYGKLLKQLNPSSGGWDGNFNGKAMIADDYWFLIEYRDADTGEIRKYNGNFSLIR